MQFGLSGGSSFRPVSPYTSLSNPPKAWLTKFARYKSLHNCRFSAINRWYSLQVNDSDARSSGSTSLKMCCRISSGKSVRGSILYMLPTRDIILLMEGDDLKYWFNSLVYERRLRCRWCRFGDNAYLKPRRCSRDCPSFHPSVYLLRVFGRWFEILIYGLVLLLMWKEFSVCDVDGLYDSGSTVLQTVPTSVNGHWRQTQEPFRNHLPRHVIISTRPIYFKFCLWSRIIEYKFSSPFNALEQHLPPHLSVHLTPSRSIPFHWKQVSFGVWGCPPRCSII